MRRLLEQSGFTFIEMLVTLALTLILFAAGGNIFMSGNAIWDTGDSHVRLQENLRFTLERIASEVRESNAEHIDVDTNGVIKFSVPVQCETGARKFCVEKYRSTDQGAAKACVEEYPVFGGDDCIKVCEPDEITNDENMIWGATLHWDCKTASCMDADDDCDNIEYKFISYHVNSNNKLMRSVLDETDALVSEEDMGAELFDLQFALAGSVLTITAVAQEVENDGRVLTEQTSLDVYLRN
ncbi:MAG: prepilin-type N-terminal cleavage/methylation domain-containing protein [Candidatus Omnitrophota bacterium]